MLATHAAISINSYEERNRTRSSDNIRRRALERLYERRATVDELIEALERYQDKCRAAMVPCIEINAVPKCS